MDGLSSANPSFLLKPSGKLAAGPLRRNFNLRPQFLLKDRTYGYTTSGLYHSYCHAADHCFEDVSTYHENDEACAGKLSCQRVALPVLFTDGIPFVEGGA